MHFHIVSLFPEFFDSPLQTALMHKAREAGLVDFSLHNPRDHGLGVHRSVDDRPYGGGPGMVLMLEPLLATLRGIDRPGRILVMAPGGKPFTQALARQLAEDSQCTLVCGRYEGFDARLADLCPVEYVSVGDVVLNGGEVPALAVIEAVARLIPGFMGKEESGTEESFSASLLEYPHYTRPEVFEGQAVPEILRSGDHGKIAAWRREQSLSATLGVRPDLLHTAELTEKDAAHLAALPRRRLGRNLHVALVHHPVIIEGKNSGSSSLTNLDIHDIARSSRTYGLGGFFVTTPLHDQRQVLEGILHHWLHGPARTSHPDRAEALSLVQGVACIEDAVAEVEKTAGQKPLLVGTTARWPGKKCAAPQISFARTRQWLTEKPVLLLLGTGHGLAPEVLTHCDGLLRPLRFLDGYNHLSVRAAAAILLDRILGDTD